MKKHRFIRLGLSMAAILSITGAILIGIGFAQGGDVYALGINFSFGMPEINSKDTYKKDITGVKELDVQLDKGSISIVEGDTATIEINGLSEDDFEIDFDDTKLYVKEKTKNRWFNFNLLSNDIEIVISLPKDQMSFIKVQNDMGNIDITNISAKEFQIKNDMGSINMLDIISDELSVKNDMGSIAIEGILNNESEIKNNLGSIDVEILDTSDHYSYTIDKDLGNANVENGRGNKSSHEADAKNNLDVSTDLGNINIIFRK